MGTITGSRGEAEPGRRRDFPAGEEGRRRAAEVCARLEPNTPTVRRAVVEGVDELEDMRGREACERLGAESERLAEESAAAAVEVAELAFKVARLVPGEATWRASLEGYAAGFLGKALRAAGDLAGAEKALARSLALRQAGAGRGLVHLVKGEQFLDREAWLCRDRGRLAEALALHDRALELVSAGHVRARLLVNQGETLAALGEHSQALGALEEAAQHLDRWREPRLWWALRHNLAVNLCRLGRHEEARALLPELRRGAESLGKAFERAQLRRLEGELAARAGAQGGGAEG
ncbi:MAG TPA: tetratricopeptide repeat protein [Thermoanaerobaculia bacterium]|nr:tetratricopeptide repeat protein [Thermoanaerobaculia bacterium]